MYSCGANVEVIGIMCMYSCGDGDGGDDNVYVLLWCQCRGDRDYEGMSKAFQGILGDHGLSMDFVKMRKHFNLFSISREIF